MRGLTLNISLLNSSMQFVYFVPKECIKRCWYALPAATIVLRRAWSLVAAATWLERKPILRRHCRRSQICAGWILRILLWIISLLLPRPSGETWTLMSNPQANPDSGKKTQPYKQNHVPHISTISLSQFRPFLDIAIPFFKQDRAACCCLIGTIFLTVSKSLILVFFSYARRDMFSALNHKNSDDFYDSIVKFFGVLVVFVPIAVVYHHLRLRLALHWRKEMTIWVLDKYYSNRTYYIIECCRDIDNPDQRISEDLRELTSTSLEFFFILFKATTNLLLF